MDATSTTTLSTKRSAEEVPENAKRRKTDTEMADDTTEQEVANNGESKDLQRFKTLLKSYAHGTEEQQVQKLAKKIKDGILLVQCTAPKTGFGRVNPKGAMSLGSLRKDVRHTLCGDDWWDFDAAYDGFSPDELA